MYDVEHFWLMLIKRFSIFIVWGMNNFLFYFIEIFLYSHPFLPFDAA